MTHQQLCARIGRLEQVGARYKTEDHTMAVESGRLKPCQLEVFQTPRRFRVLVAGRRFGKTYLALVELLKAAAKPGSLVWYVAPTYGQAKRVAWKPLKKLTRPYWASTPNETDMRIELRTGGTICVRGADNYDALRGDGLDFVVLDEYASMAQEAWQEVIRPALADKQGHALFIGTPHGYNHFYDLYQTAQNQPGWATFQFTTEEGGNVKPEELESATHELDEKTYRQEFQARFENLTGGVVYYAFDRVRNVSPQRFNPALPLFWSLDFNINPMCSVIGQRAGKRLYILDELVLPDSNTGAACDAFLERISQWRTSSGSAPPVYIYGDASGNGRHTAASRTDWQTVRDSFKRFPYPIELRVPSANPPVKDRVNCVNAMLRSHAGERKLFVDPECKELILDLERVHWKKDANGNTVYEFDKSDPTRSHLSDALGYYVSREFGMYPTVNLTNIAR